MPLISLLDGPCGRLFLRFLPHLLVKTASVRSALLVDDPESHAGRPAEELHNNAEMMASLPRMDKMLNSAKIQLRGIKLDDANLY